MLGYVSKQSSSIVGESVNWYCTSTMGIGMEVSFNPVVSLLDAFLKELKSSYHGDTCIPVFIAAKFMIAAS